MEAGAWGMVECLQDPGTLMYVPHNWYHATINEGEVVSVAHNCQMESSEFCVMSRTRTECVLSGEYTVCVGILTGSYVYMPKCSL